MSASHRRLRVLGVTLAVALVAALTLTAAPAGADVTDPPKATITWSFADGEVVDPASPAYVSVAGSWKVDPAQSDPTAYIALHAVLLVDATQVDDATLTPEQTTANFSLDTRDLSSHAIRVEVTDDTGHLVASSERNVTVSGIPTSLVADWPTEDAVKIGSKISVTGAVYGGTGRQILLQHQVNDGWETLVSTVTDEAFDLPIPATWYGKRTLRLVALASDTYAEAIAPGHAITVTPTYTPKGKKSASKVTGSRFSPCQSVTWRFNPKNAPKGALADAQKAFDAYSQATGLSFQYRGTTTVVPFKGNSPRKPLAHAKFRGFDIAVGWATPKQVPSLAGKTLGLGGVTTFTGARDAKDFDEIATSEVVFDASQKVKRGWGKGLTRGEVLLHQIGGALGLAGLSGTKGTDQVMGTRPLGKDRFGAGDIAGLGKVGMSAGCFTG